MLFSLVTIAGEKVEREKVIRELVQQDIEWLSQSEKYGYDVLDWYIKSKEVTPENLDKAFNIWKIDKTEDRAPDNIVAQGLGVLFGNYVIKHKQARWVIVTDSFGTDIALLSPNEAEAYPVSSVWKRIDPENEDINFFEPLYSIVINEHFPSNP
tara:strand:- start:23821 stop:24282 length:462 start_codon:yes stop_codon:yes gene_type:complete